jgi:phosphonate transport system permease protein
VRYGAKLLGEALEETARGPVKAMVAVGAARPSVFLKIYGLQVKPAFLSIVLLRWDINVRESAVLGLDAAINVFQWRAVAAVLVAVFAVVLVAEVAVTAIHKRVL